MLGTSAVKAGFRRIRGELSSFPMSCASKAKGSIAPPMLINNTSFDQTIVIAYPAGYGAP